MTLAELDSEAHAAGLTLRGGFPLEPDERVGALVSARALILLGVVGNSGWPAFAASREYVDGQAHPLDRWSRRIVLGLAARFGAVALFPFEGPPYWPFQAWARRAEPVAPSPLGLLVHPRYGLWHSYRGALAFPQDIDLPTPTPAESPCQSCEAQPCLSACPAGAFSRGGYDVAACADWLRRPEGGACRECGCLARRACPVGRHHAHTPEQAAFHMRAFLAARG